jgi:hypothetical protein
MAQNLCRHQAAVHFKAQPVLAFAGDIYLTRPTDVPTHVPSPMVGPSDCGQTGIFSL